MPQSKCKPNMTLEMEGQSVVHAQYFKDHMVSLIWATRIPKADFLIWRTRQKKVPMRERLLAHEIQTSLLWLLFGNNQETINHVFYKLMQFSIWVVQNGQNEVGGNDIIRTHARISWNW